MLKVSGRKRKPEGVQSATCEREERNPGVPAGRTREREMGLCNVRPCIYIHICMYVYSTHVCVCVHTRLCAPVKYEHAGVKPAIDRGKRRERKRRRAHDERRVA